MQNSIKIENSLFGETTFSGGISTTNDQRLGAESNGGSKHSSSNKYVPASGSGLTNKQVFDLMKTNNVLCDQHFLYSAYYNEYEVHFRTYGVPIHQFTFAPNKEFHVQFEEL